MLRRAGVTQLPGITPSDDQFGELIPEINRMMAGFSLDGHKIFTVSADRYTLTAGQETYLIGPTAVAAGGALIPAVPGFDAPSLLFIERANIVVLSSSPELHLPLKILTPRQWADKTITHIAASWPWELYSDGASPNAMLHLRGYPNEVNDLELFTWQQLESGFTSEDNAVLLPPGYEDMIVACGAVRVRRLYPYDSKLTGLQVQDLEKDAARALQWVKIYNTRCPPMKNEAANLNDERFNGDLAHRGIL